MAFRKPYETLYTTPATIWIGVMPDTTTGEQAYSSSRDILDLLRPHNIVDVDVAYRESEVSFSAGPELFAPVSNLDSLRDVIDNLSTALILPIAGLKTDMQGSLEFYFRLGEELYAVTARHVLFKVSELNVEYNYIAGPKKKVIVMGPNAFTAHLAFPQRTIHILHQMAQNQERDIASLKALVEGAGSHAEKSKLELQQGQTQWTEMLTKVNALEACLETVTKKWSKAKDRVIGHVDVCVIKLDKDKFRQIKGNMLSLGPEMSLFGVMSVILNPCEAPHQLSYPMHGYFKLQGILTQEEMHTAPQGDPMRRVLKRGAGARPTTGCLSAFSSHVWRYYPTGNLDSVETTILLDERDLCPLYRAGYVFTFFGNGDSGSAIVDARGRFVALLTGGAGGREYSDITYGTPMHWLWPLILAKFDGASLDWDDDRFYLY